MELKLTKSQKELLNHGQMLATYGKTYYFLPFWFEQTDVDNVFKTHSLEKLPKELVDAIEYFREKEK